MQKFSARVEIIEINPYVEIPRKILLFLQKKAKKEKGPIPVKGRLKGKSFQATVVKFRKKWRLYLNTRMRKDAGLEVGDGADVEIDFDGKPRFVSTPKELAAILSKSKTAELAFSRLPHYRQKEINRYLASLKTDVSRKRNIEKIIRFLVGEKQDGVIFRNK